MTANIIRVYVPGPFWQPLDYLFPTHWQTLPAIGSRVLISLRNREVVGIVAAISETSHVPTHKLKWINKILDEEPLFDAQQLEFLRWLADYYHASMGDVCHMAMPKLLREGKKIPNREITVVRLTEKGKALTENDFKRSPKQKALWQRLQEVAYLPAHQIKALGIHQQSIKKMLESECIEFFNLPNEVQKPNHIIRQNALTLLPAQDEAVRRILSSQNMFQTFLLNGVTGSGKTEVYLQVIEALVKQGQQALVLVPEIGLTPQTVERFVQRFGHGVLALHSGLNDSERLQAWLAAKDGLASVIIGTRSAIFAPFKNLGIIILDEEHDASFKQHDNIRYSARDAAVVLGNMRNIPVVLGSATPSFESWANAKKNRYVRIDLPERTAGAMMPAWHFIDLRNKTLQDGLSEELLTAIEKHLQANQQVLLFLNRRGFSPAWVCPQCAWSPICSHCDTLLTYHAKPLKLACHHCGHNQKIMFACVKCHGKMQPLGLGTQRVEHALQQRFLQVPILRIDRDSTSTKNSFEQILEQVHQGQPQILIGTQMVAKGHHFPQVTMVGVLNADGGLYSADFRAPEHIAQLVLQVAGRAGRAQAPGEVYVQTYWPDHPLWQDLPQKNGYEIFANQALQQREVALLPPYRYAVILRAEAKTSELAENFLADIARRAKDLVKSEIAVLGPIAALQAKRAGYYRSQLLLIGPSRADLQQLLRAWVPEIYANPQSHKVRWHVDVDPMEFD